MKNQDMPANPAITEDIRDFGSFYEAGLCGLTKLEYAAIHLPEPSESDVDLIRNRQRQANPHNDHHKPPLQDNHEIRALLRVRNAKALLAELEKE